MNRGRLIWGIICLAIAALLAVLNFTLPPENLMFTQYRRAGFYRALEMYGLPARPEWEMHGDLTERDGYAAACQLLQGARRPTAIVAGNDLMAIGAMRAAREHGLSVGQEFSVVGFDDITLAEHAHPALTTVRQPIYEIGLQVCRMLVQILQAAALPEPGQRQSLFEPELVIRQSSGPPP